MSNKRTSQISDQCEAKIVPWRSAKEWLLVYNLVFSEEQKSSFDSEINLRENYKKGLSIINIWLARISSTPWAVICTANFLAVMSEEIKLTQIYLSVKTRWHQL